MLNRKSLLLYFFRNCWCLKLKQYLRNGLYSRLPPSIPSYFSFSKISVLLNLVLFKFARSAIFLKIVFFPSENLRCYFYSNVCSCYPGKLKINPIFSGLVQPVWLYSIQSFERTRLFELLSLKAFGFYIIYVSSAGSYLGRRRRFL